MIILKDWSLAYAIGDEENGTPRLRGKVFGHKTKIDGELIMTGLIIKINKRKIQTDDDAEYTLYGEPEAGYSNWLVENGFNYDTNEPVKIKNEKN